VLDEIDHEQFELGAGNLLFLDGDDLAHAMRGIHDELASLEALPLRRLPAGDCGGGPLVRLAANGDFDDGSPPPDGGPRGLRCPPARAGCGLFGSPGHDGSLLRTMTRFACHGGLRGSHVPSCGFLGSGRKIRLPRGSFSAAALCSFFNYIAHFSSKSKPYGWAKPRICAFRHYNFVTWLTGGANPRFRLSARSI